MHHVIYVLNLNICFNVACGQSEEGQNLTRGQMPSLLKVAQLAPCISGKTSRELIQSLLESRCKSSVGEESTLICSYGPLGIITQRAKTDPASRNQGQFIWSALIVSLRGVWSGYMLLQRWGFPQMGHEESRVPPSETFDRSLLLVVEQQFCTDQLTPLLSKLCT